MDHENKKTHTDFASAERSGPIEIMKARNKILSNPLIIKAFDALPEIALILNAHRQIIYCNQTFRRFLSMDSDQIIGKRPGEALSCVNSKRNEAGCGTSRFCQECGAVKAILVAQQGKVAVEECRLTAQNGDKTRHYDLRVWSLPLEFPGENYTVFFALDIASEKRK